VVEWFAVKGSKSGWNMYTPNLGLHANLDSSMIYKKYDRISRLVNSYIADVGQYLWTVAIVYNKKRVQLLYSFNYLHLGSMT